MRQLIPILAVSAASLILTGPASASLVEFQSYNGNVGLSTDGFGSNSNSGVITASAESGSTVLAAYLYTATHSFASTPTTVSFEGNTVTYDTTVPNATACCSLASHRVDVTSVVSAAINGGVGGVYNFDIDEGAQGNNVDGHALVVVYENPTLPDASVGILDGFASVIGDNTAINFADPLDTTDPAFFAEMRLGINFSCNNQRSSVSVNGTLITENAGNFDDGDGSGTGTCTNGNLITVGGYDDPFSSLLPSYADDSERYDLEPYVTNGATSISVDTVNASQDDNIFLAAFYVSGEAGFNEPPPTDMPTIPLPASIVLLGFGLAGLGGLRRFRRG